LKDITFSRGKRWIVAKLATLGYFLTSRLAPGFSRLKTQKVMISGEESD
jgi:hypothetical protein